MLCTIRIEDRNIRRSGSPSGWPKRGSSPRSERSASPMTSPRGDDKRAVQDRVDQTTQAVADHRRGRIRHRQMGRLVQPPPPLRTLRRHPTSRTGERLLRSTAETSRRLSSHNRKSPDSPGRFKMKHPRFHAHLVTCDRCAFRRGVERSTRPRPPRADVGRGGASACVRCTSSPTLT